MIRFLSAICISVGLWIPASGAAFGQGTDIAFGGVKADPTQPVEVTADTLNVDQTDGTAIFKGNVAVVQGDLRLTAEEVRVDYSKDDKRTIETVKATGGVTLVSATDAAKSQEAVYTLASGVVVMTGDVLLTQGSNAMSGQALTVDLTTGKGHMEGRVKTILEPAKTKN
jgi:lipopolysaccharide export system protein LptA